MAGTRTHVAATVIASAVVAASAIAAGGDALTVAAGVLFTLEANPDKDQAVRGLWWLYGKLPHRSPLSHWPILGTAGRALYVGLPIVCLIEVLCKSVVWDLRGVGVFFVGMVIGDAVHWLLDQRYFGIAVSQD